MIHRLLGLALITFAVAGCADKKEEQVKTRNPVVYAVNYPLAYFAERIAGNQIKVVFPEMEGDPAFWEPSPEQVAQFQDADLILLNGASYAKWVPKVSLPQAKLLNTSSGHADQYIPLDGAMNHTHGPGGAHAHGDLAFTTWLDPTFADQQAVSLMNTLSIKCQIDVSGYQDLHDDLLKLDADLRDAFLEIGQAPLLGSHPVYQYLEKRYMLNMKSVHWEPDVEPDDQQWRELEDILEAHPAQVMLWEGEPLESTKAMLAEKGIQSIVFDPCGNRPDEGDYMDVMNQNVMNLKVLN